MKSSSQKTFVSPCLVSELCVREKSEKEGQRKDGGKEEERERTILKTPLCRDSFSNCASGFFFVCYGVTSLCFFCLKS